MAPPKGRKINKDDDEWEEKDTQFGSLSSGIKKKPGVTGGKKGKGNAGKVVSVRAIYLKTVRVYAEL
jgi:hypothetical protein